MEKEAPCPASHQGFALKFTSRFATSPPTKIRTRRSKNPVDYTTFGELGDIVRKNWPTFDDTFNNQRAFNRIMSSLNVLRGPIAHCCPLADDEIDRLRLMIKD